MNFIITIVIESSIISRYVFGNSGIIGFTSLYLTTNASMTIGWFRFPIMVWYVPVWNVNKAILVLSVATVIFGVNVEVFMETGIMGLGKFVSTHPVIYTDIL